MAVESTYEAVAKRCSQFDQRRYDVFENAVDVDNASTSCKNCTHFKDHHCELDLYDKINTNLTFWNETEY